MFTSPAALPPFHTPTSPPLFWTDAPDESLILGLASLSLEPTSDDQWYSLEFLVAWLVDMHGPKHHAHSLLTTSSAFWGSIIHCIKHQSSRVSITAHVESYSKIQIFWTKEKGSKSVVNDKSLVQKKLRRESDILFPGEKNKRSIAQLHRRGPPPHFYLQKEGLICPKTLRNMFKRVHRVVFLRTVQVWVWIIDTSVP